MSLTHIVRLISIQVDTKKEYNYSGRGLKVHEERTSIHAIRKAVMSCQPGTTQLPKPTISIHAISIDFSCKIGRKSPYLQQKEHSTVWKGHHDEGNPYQRDRWPRGHAARGGRDANTARGRGAHQGSSSRGHAGRPFATPRDLSYAHSHADDLRHGGRRDGSGTWSRSKHPRGGDSCGFLRRGGLC